MRWPLYFVRPCTVTSYSLGLKVCFVSCKHGYSTFFCFPLAWKIFSHTCAFSLTVFLQLKWVSWRQHISFICELLSFQPMNLLDGEFSPSIFKVRIDTGMDGVTLVIVFHVFSCCRSTCPFLIHLVFFFVICWFSRVVYFDSFLFMFCVSTTGFALWLPGGFKETSYKNLFC